MLLPKGVRWPMTTVDRWTGHEAKLLRQALRLSVRDFAARLGIGVRTVNKWEARLADITPLPHMQEVLDTALARASDGAKTRFAAATRTDAPEHETAQPSGQAVRGAMLPVVVTGRLMFTPVEADALAVAPLVGHADLEPRERLASAARRPSRVDPVAVEHLELVTQTHRSLYHHLSSAELIPAVTGHLQVTTLLLRGTQPLPLRRRLAAIAGETAGHAAWLFHDLGDQYNAAHYYAVAEVAIREAGDPALDAYVRGFRSLVMGSQGQAREALGFVRGAVEIAERSATATTRAWLASLEARTLASVGDTKSCCGALCWARTAIGQSRREEDPAWMYEFDYARLLAVSGACYGQLGKTAAAEQTLREALDALGPKRSRRRAEVLVDLARVHARQQDAEEAAGVAGEALEIAVETGSPAGIQRVRRFRPELAGGNGTRAVTALDEQLAHAF
jgi:transcriptional regulator with XRE-family HTH domain/tetratricopeptide (TPR) repeat protein